MLNTLTPNNTGWLFFFFGKPIKFLLYLPYNTALRLQPGYSPTRLWRQGVPAPFLPHNRRSATFDPPDTLCTISFRIVASGFFFLSMFRTSCPRTLVPSSLRVRVVFINTKQFQPPKYNRTYV